MGSFVHRMCLGLAIFGAGSFFAGSALAAEYVVQSGDTLSEIAHKQFIGPIYGKNGSLRALARANNISELNKINAGEKLVLPMGFESAQVAEKEPVRAPASPQKSEEKSEPKADPPQAQEETPRELVMRLEPGFGGAFVQFRQSGSLGGINGASFSLNSWSLKSTVSYGPWIFRLGWEKYSVLVDTDTSAPVQKERKDFRRYRIDGGNGLLFGGLVVASNPVSRLTGTTLQWGDVNKIYAIGGLRARKLFDGGRKKPFLVGGELEGGWLLRSSGSGGVDFTSGSGWRAGLRANLEKVVKANEDWRLFYGLACGIFHERTTFNANWGGNLGEVKQEISEFDSHLYLGLEF